jgi:branched-chain amino acid transport system permease protein
MYALVALGYTMVYGVLGMINFAHGEIFMIGMFACVYAIGVFSARLGQPHRLNLGSASSSR